MVGEHISKSFVADAEQNLIVLRSTREEMSKLKKRMEEAEVCEDTKQRWEEWKSICESVMRFEQYDNETPFMKYRDCSDILYGKKSSEYGDSILLYAEYLYYLYSADEEPVKLNMAKKSCESAIGRICLLFLWWKEIFRSDSNPSKDSNSNSNSLRLASALELYGSVLSAIRNTANDKVGNTIDEVETSWKWIVIWKRLPFLPSFCPNNSQRIWRISRICWLPLIEWDIKIGLAR